MFCTGIVTDIKGANKQLTTNQSTLQNKVNALKTLSRSHKTNNNIKSCKYIILMNLFLGCLVFTVALIAFILKPELIPLVQQFAMKR